MNRLDYLKKQLKPGTVYRRTDLAQWSKSVDRHARELVDGGVLQKLQNGLYYFPKSSLFGLVPANEHQLVKAFLKDGEFLLTSPNAYNALGLGSTQLYNSRVVYNHKRHGIFELGGQKFEFRRKYRFPKKMTKEFLLVDLMNNLKSLAEDQNALRRNVAEKALRMEPKKLKRAVKQYANVASKKYFDSVLANVA
ncbi:MAG: hypothetical protein ACC707_01725 [Thiohalomonadales bacterium]